MQIAGLPVVDAKRRIRITITEADTVKGAVKDPSCCAAARAAVRDVPNCTAARIHLGRAYIKLGNRWLRFHTSQSLRAEIIAFDRGAKFQAGEYTLSPMSPSETSAAQKLAYRNRKAEKNRKRPSHTKSPRKLYVAHGVRPRGANK